MSIYGFPWPPKDWRSLLAILFLAGGGMAVTVILWRIIGQLEFFRRPDALANIAYGSLFLIGIVLTGFSVVLGRRSFKGEAGPVKFEVTGEDDD